MVRGQYPSIMSKVCQKKGCIISECTVQCARAPCVCAAYTHVHAVMEWDTGAALQDNTGGVVSTQLLYVCPMGALSASAAPAGAEGFWRGALSSVIVAAATLPEPFAFRWLLKGFASKRSIRIPGRVVPLSSDRVMSYVWQSSLKQNLFGCE